MRTTLLHASLLAVALATGCKWTEFDDLENQAWVESIEKPDSEANDWGITLQRGVHPSIDGSGGNFVTLGVGQPLYMELDLDPKGKSSIHNELKLNSQYSIPNLDTVPIVISEPTSHAVAIVTNNAGNIAIIVFTQTEATPTPIQIFNQTTPTAATFFKAPGHTAAETFVAVGDTVFGQVATPAPQQLCHLVDDAGTPVMVNGMVNAKVTSQTDDDLVVWSSDGKLYLYPGSTFDGCATPQAPIAPVVDVGFSPMRNASMTIIDGHYVLLGGRHENDAKSRVVLYDLMPATPVVVGNPIDRDGQRAWTFLDRSEGRYVMVGFPLEPIDGTPAGQVLAYKLSTTTGLDANVEAILHDAQPSGNQAFGRALQTIDFNGSSILVVGAENELFAYFQSPFYGETRQ